MINRSGAHSTLLVSKLNVNSLRVDKSIGFFGAKLSPQVVSSGTLISLVDAMKDYGLSDITVPAKKTGSFSGKVHTGAQAHINRRAGFSIAMSSDGNTVAVGAPGANNVYIYVKTKNNWIQQGPSLFPADLISSLGFGSKHGFGAAVSLSRSGNVLCIGHPALPYLSDTHGGAWVYRRVGTAWLGPTLLVYPDEERDNHFLFGKSVSVSPDGKIIAVGDPDFGSGRGEIVVYSFDQSDGSATMEARIDVENLIPSEFAPGITSLFGTSVFISDRQYDGSCIFVVGAPLTREMYTFYSAFSLGTFSPDTFGYSHVFNYKDGASEFIDSLSMKGENFFQTVSRNTGGSLGFSISASPNGNVVAVGAPEGRGGRGCVYIYEKLPTGKYKIAEELRGSGTSGSSKFGYSVSMNTQSTLLAVGGPEDGENGAVWLFQKGANGWEQKGHKVTDPVSSEGGRSVTIGGTHIASGGPETSKISPNEAFAVTDGIVTIYEIDQRVIDGTFGK